MMDLTNLSEIRSFIDECKSDPSLLSTPSLSFFLEYLKSLGAKLPNAAYEEDDKVKGFVVDEEQFLSVGLENVDLQGETVEPNCDPTQKERDLSDENREAAQELKGKAMDAVSEGKFYKAILHFTRAISMNPTSAILYGNRACVYIKLKNPKAAFRDAVTALKINPDSAKGYKARGMARAMLGEWAEAEKDLQLASMIDYDAEISDVLKEIEERRRQRSHAEAQAAYVKAKKQERSSSSRQDAKKQERSSSNRHRQEPRRQEQSSSSRQSRGGFPGSFPGGSQGCFPGMFPDGFLGGFPGSLPVCPQMDFLEERCSQMNFLGGFPGQFPSRR